MKKFFKSTYFAIILLFLYVPLATMIVVSFTGGNNVGSITGWSTKWYWEFTHNNPMISSIVTSLFVGVLATVISLIIGVMAAIGLSKCKSVTQKSWLSIANIPLINADIVTAVSLMIVFLLLNFRFGLATLLLAHISFDVPYVLITVMPGLKKIDSSMIEAAQDLGAKPWQVLWRVILPVLKPAIITAAAIAFSMSFDDFIISYFTGGSKTNISLYIYAAKMIRPSIYAFGAILIGVIALGVIIWNIVKAITTKKAEEKEQIRKGYYKSKRIDKLSEKLNQDYIVLNTREELVKSKNIFVWIHYAYLKLLIKLYSIRNFDKKISRLEWKQYKIKNEIRNEKRYVSRLLKVNKSINKITKEIEKNKLDKSKVKKLNKRLDDLEDKKAFLESEIEWMNNRDEKASIKAKKLQKQIRHLQREMKKDYDSLTKSDLAWYRKKIKNLEEYKLEVEEGKEHYKLRMTTERLVELKELRNNKIYELEAKLDKVKSKAYSWKPIGWRFDKKLAKANREDSGIRRLISNSKEYYIGKRVASLQNSIIKYENKLDKTNSLVAAKQEKLLPDDNGSSVKPKNWFQRSWKVISISILGIGAFSGLTAGYVITNTYDITVGNWGEYINPQLLNKFRDETGIKVNYQEYDSNETMYNKLRTFQYDLMIPSDYMVQKLATEGKIQRIDWSKLNIETPKGIVKDNNSDIQAKNGSNQGKQKIVEQLQELMDLSKVEVKNGAAEEKENILNFAVPYFWGDLIVVFNNDNAEVRDYLNNEVFNKTDEVKGTNDTKSSELSLNGRDDFYSKGLGWDVIMDMSKKYPDLRLSLSNDPKNLFMIADEALFGKVNFDEDGYKDEISKAKDYIAELTNGKNSNKVSLQGDDMIQTVTNSQFDIAVMYNGDYLNIANGWLNPEPGDNGKVPAKKNPYVFARPWTGANYSEGKDKATHADNQRTNVYSDNMVINSSVEKGSKKEKQIYEFINFMTREDNAKENSEYVGLASPYESTFNDLRKDGLSNGEGDWGLGDLYAPVVTHDKEEANWAISEDSAPLAFQFNDEIDKLTVRAYNEVTEGKHF